MSLKRGEARLYNHALPALKAGDYRVTTAQQVVDSGGTPQLGATSASFDLTVTAPRLRLSPADVAAVYPPPEAREANPERIAHIALSKRSLPWMRTPDDMRSPDGHPLPWLALLLFADDEVTLETAGQASDLTWGSASMLATKFPGVDPDEPCVFVQAPQSLLKKVLPHRDEELPFLTHVREVSTMDKEGAADDDGFVAFVLGNRLPVRKGQRYTAMLVNLEGVLDDNDHSFWPSTDEIDKPEPLVFVPGVIGTIGPGAIAEALKDTVTGAVLTDPRVGTTHTGVTRAEAPSTATHATTSTATTLGRTLSSSRSMDLNALRNEVASASTSMASAFRHGAGLAIDTKAVKTTSTAFRRTAPRRTAASTKTKATTASRSTFPGFATSTKVPGDAVFDGNVLINPDLLDMATILDPFYRLPVLHHWSFTTADEVVDFETLAKAIGSQAATHTDDGVSGGTGLLGADLHDTAEHLPSGHVWLPETQRDGTASHVLYRSPFVASPTQTPARPQPGDPITLLAKQRIRRTPLPDNAVPGKQHLPAVDTVSFRDSTYAAAFELGRLLALSNREVLQMLTEFRTYRRAARRLADFGRVLQVPNAEELAGRLDVLGHPLDAFGLLDRFFDPTNGPGGLGPLINPGPLEQFSADPSGLMAFDNDSRVPGMRLASIAEARGQDLATARSELSTLAPALGDAGGVTANPDSMFPGGFDAGVLTPDDLFRDLDGLDRGLLDNQFPELLAPLLLDPSGGN